MYTIYINIATLLNSVLNRYMIIFSLVHAKSS